MARCTTNFFHSQSQPQHHQHHHQRYQTLSQQQNKLLLSEDGSNGIDSEQNTLCPVIHNGSSTFNLAPENADQEHKHDIELQLHLKQQQQQQEKRGGETSSTTTARKGIIKQSGEERVFFRLF